MQLRDGICWGLVPARSGSKSVALKNLALLGGRPLLDYGVLAARQAGLERIVCSTDGPEIAARSRELGIVVDDRPTELAGDEAPVFERYYAGGHRTFRGFDYRGVGPRGIIAGPPLVQTDDSVGGDWLFLLSFEYNFPIYQDVLRVVLFSDTGTVQDDFGLDEYRMSVGAGLRLAVPFLGQAPFAFDFAVPVAKEPDDETQIFSFDIALPF